MTKYGKWVTQPCGKCRIYSDIGTVIEDDIDPTCTVHSTFICTTCGMKCDGATIRHGTLGGDMHQPTRKGSPR